MAKCETALKLTDRMRDDVRGLIEIVQNPRNTKSVKSAALTRLRELERRDEVDYYPSYNGVSRNPSEMARWEEENV